jgi:2,4-dienoyl-CoA reductase-like NADH-dependent reductase (Old Yellow Enzyme family)
MSPRFNRRDDEYAEPARFTVEIFRAVRAAAPGPAVYIKLNLDDFLEGSTTPAIALPVARALAEAGIDAIEVSGGTPASGNLKASRTGVTKPEDEAYLLGLARMVKKEIGCPVISVGGWRSPAVINRALAAGEVDYVAMARPFIREPDLARRWAAGDPRPATCISCNGCFKAVQRLNAGIACWVELEKQGKV